MLAASADAQRIYGTTKVVLHRSAAASDLTVAMVLKAKS
jgi:hypothetical protein